MINSQQIAQDCLHAILATSISEAPSEVIICSASSIVITEPAI